MLFYLNIEVFKNPKDTVVEEDVLDTLNDLVVLITKLNDYDSDIIFSSDFLTISICNKLISEYIYRLDEDKQKILFRRVDISSDIHCSDLYEDYVEEDLEIDFTLCKEQITNQDIFGTFLACSLFEEAPIITADKLSSEMNSNIVIVDRENDHEIKNYMLSDYSELIEKFEAEEYEVLKSWNDYIQYAKREFVYIDFTKNCIKDFRKLATRTSDKYIKKIRLQIESINKFVENNDGDPKSCDNLEEAQEVNASPETPSRLGSLSNKLMKKNCNNIKEVMDWHAKIDYYRLYFTCNIENKMCFTFFTKKIPNKGS